MRRFCLGRLTGPATQPIDLSRSGREWGVEPGWHPAEGWAKLEFAVKIA